MSLSIVYCQPSISLMSEVRKSAVYDIGDSGRSNNVIPGRFRATALEAERRQKPLCPVSCTKEQRSEVYEVIMQRRCEEGFAEAQNDY